MQYTKLGNSDLKVSRICMGCMGFGDPENGQHSWSWASTFLTPLSAIRAAPANSIWAAPCGTLPNGRMW